MRILWIRIRIRITAFYPCYPFFPLSVPAILHTGGNLPPSPSIVLFYIATHGYIVGLFFFFLLLWCHSTLYQKLSQPAIGKNTSACHRWSGCNGIGLVDVPCAVCTIPDIHRCNHSIRDRLGFPRSRLFVGSVWLKVSEI